MVNVGILFGFGDYIYGYSSIWICILRFGKRVKEITDYPNSPSFLLVLVLSLEAPGRSHILKLSQQGVEQV